jgi:hypothetical protein
MPKDTDTPRLRQVNLSVPGVPWFFPGWKPRGNSQNLFIINATEMTAAFSLKWYRLTGDAGKVYVELDFAIKVLNSDNKQAIARRFWLLCSDKELRRIT